VLVTLQLAKKVLIYFSINYIKKYTPFWLYYFVFVFG
jgi:hypothetical protein